VEGGFSCSIVSREKHTSHVVIGSWQQRLSDHQTLVRVFFFHLGQRFHNWRRQHLIGLQPFAHQVVRHQLTFTLDRDQAALLELEPEVLQNIARFFRHLRTRILKKKIKNRQINKTLSDSIVVFNGS